MIGLLMATCFPWPWPNDPSIVAELRKPVVDQYGVHERLWNYQSHVDPTRFPEGLYPWPVWGPLPDWLWNHGWALGLVTGLAGAAAGMVLLRAIKFMFERGLGKEALGLGDADLMMMAGRVPRLAAGRHGVLRRHRSPPLPLGLIRCSVPQRQSSRTCRSAPAWLWRGLVTLCCRGRGSAAGGARPLLRRPCCVLVAGGSASWSRAVRRQCCVAAGAWGSARRNCRQA